MMGPNAGVGGAAAAAGDDDSATAAPVAARVAVTSVVRLAHRTRRGLLICVLLGSMRWPPGWSTTGEPGAARYSTVMSGRCRPIPPAYRPTAAGAVRRP